MNIVTLVVVVVVCAVERDRRTYVAGVVDFVGRASVAVAGFGASAVYEVLVQAVSGRAQFFVVMKLHTAISAAESFPARRKIGDCSRHHRIVTVAVGTNRELARSASPYIFALHRFAHTAALSAHRLVARVVAIKWILALFDRRTEEEEVRK